MADFYEFTNATASDQRAALLAFRDGAPADVPGDLTERIVAFIVDASGGTRAAVDLAEAIWAAGPDINPELMMIGAAICEWANRGGYHDFGKPRGDPASVSIRIANALMRDAGVAGDWPEATDDPLRGDAPTLSLPAMPGLPS